MVRLLWWHNSCMTKSRIALSSSKRAFPAVCACREQQSPSDVITRMAKLVGEFLFSPIRKGSSPSSCPGGGRSRTQGAAAGGRVLLRLICHLQTESARRNAHSCWRQRWPDFKEEIECGLPAPLNVKSVALSFSPRIRCSFCHLCLTCLQQE